MRLKQIKLAGFKSFVDPTTVPFPDAMTAVVGPNGCGKSNIIDAVRWVLGESSAKNLRGDAMTDVIFNGSSARKPVSQASVELVFDNTSGRIQGEFANYNEISVKRVVTREAVSSYFLNGTKCRRRDITDIFLGTGLGPRSYAIIEQGMISRLIESKPQELRVFIEEAAGISKYKERRRETENRMRHTNENLDRLEDVRQELGQQLEKLQRQASAARRFKELKAKERKYKAELCALRWLKMTEHLQAIEEQVQQQETAVESFIAEQRGGELDLVKYKELQADYKSQLTQVQNKFFNLGNEITRLEQNILHTKQRKQKITSELVQLDEQYGKLQHLCEEEAEQLEFLKQSIDEKEPDQEVILEQLEVSEQALEEAEYALEELQQKWDAFNGQISQLQQQSQINRTRLQSLQELKVRSEDRIKQLKAELAELEDPSLEIDIEALTDLHASLEEKVAEYQEKIQLAQSELEQQQTKVKAVTEQRQHLTGDIQQLSAEIKSLSTLQEQLAANQGTDQWLKEQGIEDNKLWQQLAVNSVWQKSTELVLADILHAVVINIPLNQLSGLELQHLSTYTPIVNNALPNTLAAKVESEQFPALLNSVFIADSYADALSKRDSLKAGESLITADGHWFAKDWSKHGFDDQESGVIARAERIRDLQQQLTAQQHSMENLETEQQESEKQLEQQQQQQRFFVSEQEKLNSQFTEAKSQLLVKQQQQAMQQGQKDKINRELERQHEALEQELEQQEELELSIEEINEQVAEQQELRDGLQLQKEQKQQQVISCRTQQEQVKQREHQLALALQELRTRQQGMLVTLARSEQQLMAAKERKNELLEEQQESELPLEESAEQLEELLQQRLEVEQQQTELADKLAEVETSMSDVEKGHQGVTTKIQQMRSELESIRLEGESYRVRANTFVEQLHEMGQPIKPVLENMDEDAEEELWQTTLEKTTNSIGRLGAINLAAIEEFDVQSERKQFLDTQHEDLAAALETLETAIRKIDRETRAKFKETFEQVNGDLMLLFPKVFGGGSAYLELTDNDMLETGVTIMARPPGKKNSTIHLLSGGEKALTALSLVFAIFRLNPAPFCMLDEVDAPLDDANVGRFCRLVEEMSQTVQFVYISHNKIAMEMANHLTGVTMHEPGVSRMVAVDIDEAVALAEA